jgi:hypothetical protein
MKSYVVKSCVGLAFAIAILPQFANGYGYGNGKIHGYASTENKNYNGSGNYGYANGYYDNGDGSRDGYGYINGQGSYVKQYDYGSGSAGPYATTATPVPLPERPMPPYQGAGFYVGLEGGYGYTHWADSFNDLIAIAPDATTTDEGLTARLLLGYDFNRYFGLESGVIMLPEASIDGDTPTGVNVSGNITNFAVDLFAKFMLPLNNIFGLYAKLGGNYFVSNGSDSVVFPGETVTDQSAIHHIGPAFGLGAYFHIVPNLTGDIGWLHYTGNSSIFNNSNDNNDQDFQPNPDAFLIGLTYKFSPKYFVSYN